MTTQQFIPRRLNGYDIVAQTRRVLPNGQLSDAEVVILGHDATRNHSKYMTAHVGIMGTAPIREWYWGHYFEDLGQAVRSFTRRANLNLMLCTHKAEVDQHCSEIGCPNFYDFTAVNA